MSGTQEAAAISAMAGPKQNTRLGELDICRGLAILAVLFIHVSGHFLPALHPVKSLRPPSAAWYALAVPNQDFQWAVPCFLMLSAFVNALSLGRSPDTGKYARRRVQTALLPYLLWSGVYIVVDSLLSHRPFPGPLHIAKLLLTGTAHFHLYFFVLALELYVLLPLLVPLFARRPPFWAVALGAVALQAVFYRLNRYVFLHRFEPTILWEILPVALGLWLFSQADRLEEIRERGRWAAGIVTLAALFVYSPIAVAILLPKVPHPFINTAFYQFGRDHALTASGKILPPIINTALYQFGQWGYTAGMSFLMVALAYALKRGWLTTLLGYLGAESLAIYVMHPLAILALDKLGMNRHLGVGVGMALYYAACLGFPLLGAWVWRIGKTAATGRR